MPALLLLLAANPDNNTTNHSPLNSPITSAISPPQTLSPPTTTPQPSTDTQQQLPVLAATQRVQQKAAIAIGRLVVYNDTMCAALVSGGGLERLVELAVCRGARLDSDYTLVSVVTAVRKIAGALDIRVDLERLGAADLLDTDILNSLKLYSPLQESFV